MKPKPRRSDLGNERTQMNFDFYFLFGQDGLSRFQNNNNNNNNNVGNSSVNIERFDFSCPRRLPKKTNK